MSHKNELLIRVYLVFGAFVLFALVIIFKVVKIGIVEGDRWRSKGGKNVKWVELQSDRGDIYDVRGNLLATSLPYFEVRMDLLSPRQEDFDSNVDSLAICLSKYLPGDKTASSWRRELADARRQGISGVKKGTKYYFIANKVDLNLMEKIEHFPLFRKGKHKGGLIKVRSNKRFNPYESLALRTIGVDRENANNVGLEAYYDKALSGRNEKMLMEKVGPGIWVPVSDPTEMVGLRGADLVTTLDINMQDVVESELRKGLIAHKAKAGCAIIMETATGAIKAMANLKLDKDSIYKEEYNYALAHSTEPGSTFKLMSTALLLEAGISKDAKVDLLGGRRKFHDLVMYDSKMHGKRDVDLAHTLIHSSNVGIAALAHKKYGKRSSWMDFYGGLENLKINEISGVDLLGEPDPTLKHPEKNKNTWYGTTVPWMAHGYELMLTPLQILKLYNAVANDGVMMQPYLAHMIISDQNTVKQFEPKVLHSDFMENSTILAVQDMLEKVVTEGTGGQLMSELVQIAGKTGTSRTNYANPDAPKKYNASFAGYFPAEQPKYSMIISVYEPNNGKYYGGSVVGPIYKEIAERIMMIDEDLMKNEMHLKERETIKTVHAGFSKDYDQVLSFIGAQTGKNSNSRWVEVRPQEGLINFEKKKIYRKKVPNVKGMGLRDAMYVLESLGIKTISYGAGKVVKQSLAPGSEIINKEIHIHLQ